jgi:hypothetical protein
MFLVLSDLALLTRKDLTIDVSASIIASGIQGSWVTLSGTGTAFLTQIATPLAWPVFNESQRDQTVGKWAPDVLNTKQATVLSGKYFARTTKFTGTPVVGAPLDVSTNGALVSSGSVNANNVAFCIKAPYAYTYLGNSVTAMDIYVI